MSRAVLGLGTNLGDRLENLRLAVAALGALPHTCVEAVSSVYETDPVGYVQQPPFLNAVVVVKTSLSPRALLGACLGIEAAMGRRRSFPNAPRILDVDVLLIEGVVMVEEELTLPHPRMKQRGFVLVPLEELFPGHNPLGFDVSAASAAVSRAGVRMYPAASLLEPPGAE